jgi:hypothetical protein
VPLLLLQSAAAEKNIEKNENLFILHSFSAPVAAVAAAAVISGPTSASAAVAEAIRAVRDAHANPPAASSMEDTSPGGCLVSHALKLFYVYSLNLVLKWMSVSHNPTNSSKQHAGHQPRWVL